MANLTMNRGDKLIFDNDQGADTYLTQDASDILYRYINATKIDDAQVFGTSGSSNRAVVLRSNGNTACSIPLDLTSAGIQQAIDNLPVIGGLVFIPTGTYSITSSVVLRDNIVLQGCGWANTILRASGGGLTSTALLKTTISSGTTYSGIYIRDLAVDNISSGNSGAIGIDYHQVNAGGIEAVKVYNVETAIRVQGQAYYNTFKDLIISDAQTGMNFNEYTYPSGPPPVYNYPNSNRAWNVRINATDVGFDIDGDQNAFFSCSVEQGGAVQFTRGFRIKNSSGVRGTVIVAPRLENSPGSSAAYGIEIGTAAQDTTIIAPYYLNINGDNLHDASSGTTISLDVYSGFSIQGSGLTATSMFASGKLKLGSNLTVGGNGTGDAGYGNIDSVELGRYTVGNFLGTLAGGVTSPPSLTIYYQVIGKVVTLFISGLTAGSNSTAQPYVTGLPTNLRPARNQNCVGRVMNGSTVAAGIVQIGSGGNITCFADMAGTSTFSSTGNKGLQDFVGSYLLS